MGVHEIRARRKLLGVLVVGALAAVACGSDDDPSSATDGASDSTTVDGPAETAAETPGSEVVTDNTTADGPAETAATPESDEFDPEAVIRAEGDASTSVKIDPVLHNQQSNTYVLFLAYDPLVRVAPDGTFVPGLATSWEFVDDNTTLVLTLREGVSFHDGTPFDADAVKANMDRAATHPETGVKSEIAQIAEVQVVDPYRVRLVLAPNAGATIVETLAGKVGMMASPATFETLAEHPVGTGPFTFVSLEPGVKVVYARNDEYWDGPPHAAGFEFHEYRDPSAALNALRTGEIDLWFQMDPASLDQAEAAGLETTTDRSLAVMHLLLNRGPAPFDNTLVRQALSYSIDRDALAQAHGLGERTVQWPPPGSPFHVDALGENYPYDPDKARELLQEAGLEEGVEFTLIVPQTAEMELVGQQVAGQVNQDGVFNIELEVLPGPEIVQNCFTNETCDAVIAPFANRLDAAAAAQLQYTESTLMNMGGVPANVTEKLLPALAVTDEAGHLQATQDLVTEVVNDATNLYLITLPTGSAHTGDIVNWTYLINGHPDFVALGKKG